MQETVNDLRLMSLKAEKLAGYTGSPRLSRVAQTLSLAYTTIDGELTFFRDEDEFDGVEHGGMLTHAEGRLKENARRRDEPRLKRVIRHWLDREKPKPNNLNRT
jgi:hypothetical protein